MSMLLPTFLKYAEVLLVADRGHRFMLFASHGETVENEQDCIKGLPHLAYDF